MKWLVPLVCVGLSLGGTIAPRAARAAAPEGQPAVAASEGEQAIAISIDAADLPETRAGLAAVVEAQLGELLAAREDLPPGVFWAEDRGVLIELRPGPIPGGDDLLIHAIVRLEGELLAQSATETCLACSDEKVAQKALLLLEPLLAELPAPPEPPAPELPEAQAPAEDDPRPLPSAPRSPLLIPGGALLGAGVIGLGVGVGLIAANERVVSPADALELEVVKYREPGIAVAALGGAATLAGAALLFSALARGSSSKRQARVGFHGRGLVIEGAF